MASCENKYTTLLDLSRQAKIITGETACFNGKIEAGIPFSGYPTGVDTGTTVSLGVVSTETAVFSGNTGTTIFDVANTGSTNYNALFSGYSTTDVWTNDLFSGNTSGLTLPITSLSADTQIVGPFWTLTQTGMTGDYVIGTQYTGYSITYSFRQVEQLNFVTGYTAYSGFSSGQQENFSAGTLDYKGPLDYISSVEDATVDGRLTTDKLTVTGGASASTIGYVLTQLDSTGKAGWAFNSASASTNTFVTGGTLNGTNLDLTWNTGGSVPSIELSGLTFTGNTSGDCITDLFITNLYGCSPITVHDNIQSITSSATGATSFAFGKNTKAFGTYSHAEGYYTTASGLHSHAEGKDTVASGDYSHAEGQQTTASAYDSHAEGNNTTASGEGSHSEGAGTTASGSYSHSEGSGTVASGNYASHAEGYYTTASGDYGSHAEGNNTTASGNYGSHAGGKGVDLTNNIIASGETSFAHFRQTSASGNIGAYGDYSAILGGNDHNIGTGSVSSGIFAGSGNVINDNVLRSAVLGGSLITGTTDDTVYVPNLNIGTVGGGASVNNLGIDTNGNVVTGTTGGGGGATIDPYQNEGNVNSITWDVSGTSTNYEATLTGDTTLTMSNVRNGDYGTLIVTQDGTGSRTLTFGAGTHKVVNGGGGTPTLTATAGHTDILSFTYNGSTFYWTVGNDYT